MTEIAALHGAKTSRGHSVVDRGGGDMKKIRPEGQGYGCHKIMKKNFDFNPEFYKERIGLNLDLS